MRYALDDLTTRNRIEAEHGLQGFCDICEEQLIPRHGLIYKPHWAHKTLEDCDRWAEGETDWHLKWKERIASQDKNRVEVRMGNHRADVVARDGTVIELQHSSIDIPTIQERQDFYQKLVWVLDCKHYTDANLNHDVDTYIEFTPGQNNSYQKFYWKYPKRAFNYYSTARFQKEFFPVLLDIGGKLNGDGYLFLIRNIRTIDHWTGWGVLMTYSEFIRRVNESINFILSLKTYNPTLKTNNSSNSYRVNTTTTN
jgi:hypothetical protein